MTVLAAVARVGFPNGTTHDLHVDHGDEEVVPESFGCHLRGALCRHGVLVLVVEISFRAPPHLGPRSYFTHRAKWGGTYKRSFSPLNWRAFSSVFSPQQIFMEPGVEHEDYGRRGIFFCCLSQFMHPRLVALEMGINLFPGAMTLQLNQFPRSLQQRISK